MIRPLARGAKAVGRAVRVAEAAAWTPLFLRGYPSVSGNKQHVKGHLATGCGDPYPLDRVQ
ncbi:hypothetical protein GCM10020220_068140 [Nonomuraea rubra]